MAVTTGTNPFDPQPWREGVHTAVPAVERIYSAHPGAQERMHAEPALRAAVLAVVAASPWLARVCATDPLALDVLADLEGGDLLRFPEAAEAEPFDRVRRLRELGVLRIAARDLLGIDTVDRVGLRLAVLAEGILEEALASTATSSDGMAVVGLGKLGAAELNYSSDIDLMLVAPDGDTGAGRVAGNSGAIDPRPFVEVVRSAWRVDLDLRPEGRSGALVRTLASYQAYWARWAEAWEFQALLKARPVAGGRELGAAFVALAAEQVWGRPFGADELRQLRHMKARAENQLVRRRLAEREIKRGPGGIRDIEFAVQLLQLVHGRGDPMLRSAATLAALEALAAGGYVAPEDAAALASAYRFLRKVEHRLQLYEGEQVHTLPRSPDRLAHLALVMGYQHDALRSAEQHFTEDLRHHRATARSIHERLFFRPLLEAFTFSDATAVLPEEAVTERLAAFGFADAARTAQAVSELTRGFSRVSQLMQRALPLLLDWISTSPDPDQGLLGLRILASGPQSRDRLVAVCRESPAGAQQLCQLLGTAPRFARDLQRHPDSLAGMASGTFPAEQTPEELKERAVRSIRWRSGEGSTELGLRQFAQAERLRIASRDVLGLDDTDTVGRALSDVADSVITAALGHVSPSLPFAVIAMGRLGGREMGYASDVDLLLVWSSAADRAGSQPAGAPSGTSSEEAARAEADAAALVRLIGGDSPATGAFRVDLGLRPEGRLGPTARSLDSYSAYYERWAEPWERQALLRSRFVAGDTEVGERFAGIVDRFVRERPLTTRDLLEIRRTKARVERERVPAGEDPKFHLKLGPGSISDVEWTVQLLQLRHGVAARGTVDGLDRLLAGGMVVPMDAAVLRDAYRFCTRTRNRLSLIRDAPGDSLPVTGPLLSTLARSLGYTPSGLRNEYTRLTRRARRVMERLFYES